MKKLMITIAVLMIGTAALAKQKVLIVECRDGKANIEKLQQMLDAGWKVVSAVPVQDSNSVALYGKAKQAYTATIVYVLQY